MLPLAALGQARFDAQGGEYPIIGTLQGDQVFADLALNPYGGYLVWQDNATDGEGYGISARHINRNLSGSLGVFRVNQAGAGDQTVPQVAMLSNGGAAFVWQSALGGAVHVFARFLNPDGTFATGDIAVSNYTGGDQTSPTVASLKDGTVVIVWTSIGQERTPNGQPVVNGMQGIFAQRFSVTGQKLGNEFQVNRGAPYNQRNPAIAALANGQFVVVWISENIRSTKYSVDDSGRTEPGSGVDVFDIVANGQLFDANGTAIGTELALSSDARLCANPSVVSLKDGFAVAWSGRAAQLLTTADQENSWDVYLRTFAADGTPKKAEFRLNDFTYGDQFRPRTSFQDGILFVLWTSLKQDGSWEGVVAKLVSEAGDPISHEFRVNTTTAGKQVYPTLVANGLHSFLAVWSSFLGGVNSYDLFAQRYTSADAPSVPAPGAPSVSALSQTKLSVTWPELAGYAGVKYQVYVDQSSTPVVVENNSAVIVSLQPASSHSFQLSYLLANGQQSPRSDAATGTTWGEDNNYDGLPDDWQARYWGSNPAKWPGANADSDGDGATNLQELLAGTDPTDASSVLRVRMLSTSQGPRLEWNSEPGCIYQVQIQQDDQSWLSVGTPRFAAGKIDSIPVDAGNSVALYRVIRVR